MKNLFCFFIVIFCLINSGNGASSNEKIFVGEENFQKLVDFIEKNGFVVPQDGVSCDYQYTFFDGNGNRHALITIRRNEDGQPSMEGLVSHISVWAYYGGVRDQGHYFGYDITKEEAFPFLRTEEYINKHIQAVKKGYNDFLTHVNRQDC